MVCALTLILSGRAMTSPSLVHTHTVFGLAWLDRIVNSTSSNPTHPVIATLALVSFAYAICSAKFWFRRRIFFFAGENPFSLAESFSPTKNIFGSEKNFAGENWISPAKTNFRRRKKNFAGENRFSPAKKNFAGEIRISPAKKKIAYLKVHGFFYIIMDTSQTKLN